MHVLRLTFWESQNVVICFVFGCKCKSSRNKCSFFRFLKKRFKWPILLQQQQQQLLLFIFVLLTYAFSIHTHTHTYVYGIRTEDRGFWYQNVDPHSRTSGISVYYRVLTSNREQFPSEDPVLVSGLYRGRLSLTYIAELLRTSRRGRSLHLHTDSPCVCACSPVEYILLLCSLLLFSLEIAHACSNGPRWRWKKTFLSGQQRVIWGTSRRQGLKIVSDASRPSPSHLLPSLFPFLASPLEVGTTKLRLGGLEERSSCLAELG